MMTEFTPWASLFGGFLIGLAAVLLMLLHGRVFGATGILSGVLFPSNSGDWLWRAVLVLGMVSGPVLYLLLTGSFPAVEVPVSLPMLLVGGFVVGIGVTLGSGCTSGHGVCGMARLSLRSIVATCTFMLTTFVTVFVIRHLLGAG